MMFRILIALVLAFSLPALAQDKAKAEKKTEKKAQKKPAAKKPEPKASSQDWGRWSSSGEKTLDQKAKKDAKK